MAVQPMRLFAGFSFLAIGFALLGLQFVLQIALPPELLPFLGSAVAGVGLILVCAGFLGETGLVTGALIGLAIYAGLGVGLFAAVEGSHDLTARLQEPRAQLEVLSWPAVAVSRAAGIVTTRS